MEYIERDGIKYEYPVDKNGNKMIHPDHINKQALKDFLKTVIPAEGHTKLKVGIER